ncbi:MAG TPA: hypothetical protein EYP30_08435 [Archaeoglobaceae archaeon]|nr:hypothetical protein [Archaeoglobaceae archaeon]
MRTRDIIIVVISLVLFVLYLTEIIVIEIYPLAMTVVFAILAVLPFFVKDSRLRFFGYFFFGALVYWSIGKQLSEPDMLKDYFFILALAIGNGTAAVISSIERSEYSYTYSISAVFIFFSSFLMGFTADKPDISTLIIILLVLLSAIWVHFFQDLKAPQMGLKEHLTQSLKTAIITSPVFLLLLVIPSYIYNVLNLETNEAGVVLFRYILLSFVITFVGGMLRDFVSHLGGYRRDYAYNRAVFRKE